jgi:hypothetical protein
MRVSIPQYITMEDKLMGLVTFKQLFALLGAFFITYISFKINGILGFFMLIFSFGSAILFTFVYLNGKPFYKIFPSLIKLFVENKTFRWQMQKRIEYEEVLIPEAKPIVPEIEAIPERKIPITKPSIPVKVEYKSTQPPISSKIEIKLNQPIKTQFKEPEPVTHKHQPNPENPYAIFPYVKLYRLNHHG